MSRIVGIVLVGLMILLGLGILIPFIGRSRTMSDRIVSQDNLRRIGFSTAHASLPNQPPPLNAQDFFPAGTVQQPLPVEERLSWMILLLGTIGSDALEGANPNPISKKPNPFQDVMASIDLQSGWNSERNRPLSRKKVRYFLCPSNVPQWGPEDPAPTQYVGIAGLRREPEKLTLPDGEKNAGVFQYDAPTPVSSIKDGTSQTIAFSETNFQIGPWMAGGFSTVRGIDPDLNTYFGVGSPLGGLHLGGANVGMADGSVRFLSDKIDPVVFRAMCTINGNETGFERE